MPSAMSSPSEPDEITSTSIDSSALPSRMIEPLPKWRSIWESAASRAFDLSMDDPSTTRSAAGLMGCSSCMAGIRGTGNAAPCPTPGSIRSVLYTICSRSQSVLRKLQGTGLGQYQAAAGYWPATLAIPACRSISCFFELDDHAPDPIKRRANSSDHLPREMILVPQPLQLRIRSHFFPQL